MAPRPNKHHLAEQIAMATRGPNNEPLDAEAQSELVAELVKSSTRVQLEDRLAAFTDPVPVVHDAPGTGVETTTASELVMLDRERMALLKRTLASDLTDDQFAMFVARCNQARLDPFANQIHAVVRQGKLTIQTGIDGFRLIADRTGTYAGSEEPTYEGEVEGGTGSNKFFGPALATVTVRKIVQGQVFTVTRHAHWPEFYPGDGGDGFMWRKKPFLMLAKCAEAQALRAAFPADLSGMYADEEMDQATAIDVASAVRNAQDAGHSADEEVARWRQGITDQLAVADDEKLSTLSTRWKAIEPPLPALAKIASMREIRRAVALVRSVLRVEVHPADALPPVEPTDGAPGDGGAPPQPDDTGPPAANESREGGGPRIDLGEVIDVGDGVSRTGSDTAGEDAHATAPPPLEATETFCTGCGERISDTPMYDNKRQPFHAECLP